ncbi:MAG TPA: fumarylacetoacetate hydrolase family protein [Bacteroidota bacterium]|nr:fumarylacetoacetate hydrolase family protein [Bacteroidota bacterium]
MKSLMFADGENLPVGKILCLGRNYPEHVKEMNAEPPLRPVVFIKPSTALIGQGESIVIPGISSDVHHEVELVVVIGRDGRDIPEEKAMEYVAGYAVGLDMTLRDVQADAKKRGLPWSVAKGFDTSAPVSGPVRRERVGDPHALAIGLSVNGTVRQSSNTRHMILRIPGIIAYCSSIFTLEAGDLIFTGTPEGVGRVVPGDRIDAGIASVGTLSVGVR